MNKDWLHLPSLNRTIDLNTISDIQWNNQGEYDKRYRTVIYLGTSIATSEGCTIYNELSIFSVEDRKALHSKFPDIPITLSFDEVIAEKEKTESTKPVSGSLLF